MAALDGLSTLSVSAFGLYYKSELPVYLSAVVCTPKLMSVQNTTKNTVCTKCTITGT